MPRLRFAVALLAVRLAPRPLVPFAVRLLADAASAADARYSS